MVANCLRIAVLDDLRQYIYETVCELYNFEVGAFQMTERFLVRRGNPCGIHFCVHGPRSLKLTAIWETDRNSILFYGASGERLGKTLLVEAPELAAVS